MADKPSDKSAVVRDLMKRLDKDRFTRSMTGPDRLSTLEQLKVHGRDPRGSDAIYCDDGIGILSTYAFEDEDIAVSHEALRCIANALLLQAQLRESFVRLGYVVPASKIYKRRNNNDAFLGARILFLLTYGSTVDLRDLITSYDLIESMSQHLVRHVTTLETSDTTFDAMEGMALTETMKLIFNLASQLPTEVQLLSTTVPLISSLLVQLPMQVTALDPPISTAINALAIMDFASTSTTAAKEAESRQNDVLVVRLVDILHQAVRQYKPTQLDTQCISLLTVLRQVHDTSLPDIQRKMRELILPADSERDLPLGQSDSLASALLRLTIAPGLSNLPEAISSLLFELSGRDAQAFVKNIGYGFASGYLATHNILLPENAKLDMPPAETGEIPVNPVTGQRLDKETMTDLPEMTKEEKEREAERLFVLFERLKATGVVDVKNPVQQAMEEGRY